MARKPPPVIDQEDVKRVLDHIWSIPGQTDLSDDVIIEVAEIVAFKDAAETSREFRDEFIRQIKASAEWRRFRDKNRGSGS